jgi:transposase-like protein
MAMEVRTDETVMAKTYYSLELKRKLVARLKCVNAVSAAQLARETGVTPQNLSRWRNDPRIMPFETSSSDADSAKRIGRLEDESACSSA